MARIAPVTDRNEVPEGYHPTFDRMAGTFPSGSLPFYLLRSPEAAGHLLALTDSIRLRSNIPAKQRIIVTLATARHFDCAYEWPAFVRLAAGAGIDTKTVDAIGHGRALDGLDAEDTLLIRFSRELLRDHRVSDETFSAAKERYGEQGVLELSIQIGLYALVACTANVIELEPPSGASPLP